MKCFVMSPIGSEGSEARGHADEVFNHIIVPALEHFSIQPVRADHMADPGRISDQMYRAIFEYDLCIAVLTPSNPNVYYELAIAQSASRPVIMLVEKGESLPFDVKDFRVLTYDLSISSYKSRTHIDRLIAMLDELKQLDWRGDDLFRAYRASAQDAVRATITSYGIKIDQPAAGADVDIVDVRGTYQIIPPGFELRALRYYPTQNGFVPQGTVHIDRLTKTWRVIRFDIGGWSQEERGIDITLAGQSARILLDYWQRAHEVHADLHRLLLAANGAKGRWLPPITAWPEDLLTCDRRMVRRI